MKKIRTILLAIMGVVVGQAFATEYFVDGNRPDNSGDGLTVETAKKTIQAAVDLTQEKDIVTVLPGLYGDSEGTHVGSDTTGTANYRVVIPRQILLRSRDGAAKTVIQGKFGSGSNRLGTGAIRGVFMRGVSYAAVEGFTITGCASVETSSSGNAHYGTAVAGNWNSYVLGCILSNNVSVAGTVYTCTAVATLFIDNTATASSAIGVNSYYWNCVMANNKGESLLNYTAGMANCTVVDNPNGTAGGRDCTYYNCVLVGNSQLDGNTSYATLAGTVTDSAASRFKSVDAGSLCGASRYQHVAPAFCDWRLRTGSDAIGRGTIADYNKVVNEQKIKVAVSSGYLPQSIQDRYVDRDFAGNLIVAKDGKIDAGAIQGSVAVKSGIVVFNGQVTSPVSPIPCRTYSYASTEAWPSIVTCKGYSTSDKPTFYQQNTGAIYAGGADSYKYPGVDGYVSFGLPPTGYVITNRSWFANSIVYAKPDGNDNATGADPEHALRTVRKAVDVASTKGSYALVRLLPGVYAEGTTNVYGLASRFFVNSKSMRIESTEGAEKTFIVGAASAGSAHLGLGPDAVRCMGWYTTHNDASVCGVTFCGGRTDYCQTAGKSWDSWDVSDKNCCGAVYVKTANSANVHFQDCVFSNNCALISAVNQGGEYQRCRFVGNAVGNASGSICRNGDYTCCEFFDNDSKNYVHDTTIQNLYFCTVEGNLSPYQSNVYGTILVNPGVSSGTIERNNKVYDGNVVPVGYSVTALSGTTGTRISYLNSDPSFVDGKDGCLWNYSKALGGATVANLTALTLKATRDLDGNGLFLRNGYPSAGAHQYPMQAVYVAGPAWGIEEVIGGSGTIGTNAVAIGSSITVKAFAEAKGRKFLGFTVNGVDLPKEGREYTYVAGKDLTEAVPEILARYSKLGFCMIVW